MASGVIKALVADRGFGFIRPDGDSVDVFFHCSALDGVRLDELDVGDRVTFEEETGPDGRRRAARVDVGGRVIQPAAAGADADTYDWNQQTA